MGGHPRNRPGLRNSNKSLRGQSGERTPAIMIRLTTNPPLRERPILFLSCSQERAGVRPPVTVRNHSALSTALSSACSRRRGSKNGRILGKFGTFWNILDGFLFCRQASKNPCQGAWEGRLLFVPKFRTTRPSHRPAGEWQERGNPSPHKELRSKSTPRSPGLFARGIRLAKVSARSARKCRNL
jgi:hypothetical protein